MGAPQLNRPLPCVECGADNAVLASGETIHPHRPDLRHRSFWRCECGAFVGCHPGTTKALGAPAGPETRQARRAAHDAFDRIWLCNPFSTSQARKQARSDAYAWLAGQMGLPVERCHISYMTADKARRVVAICEERKHLARLSERRG